MKRNPAGHWCSKCNRGPLLSWERAGSRCLGCADAIVVELKPGDVESAVRQFICATHPELAEGYIITVNAFTAVAYKPE